ncbi:MAG: tRNA (5-methylaminomethyl-2-thiouridine)(34)-methyltransferase MnmD [Bacteroidota bacterium]
MSNELFETQDGSHSLFSEAHGVSYHSKYGAVQETQHVFINAALRFKALLQSDLHILDIGFGTGLNAYMTLLEAQKRNLTIHYTAIEAYPISLELATTLNYSEVLNQLELQPLFLQMHTSEWSQPLALTENFNFQKEKIYFEQLDFSNQFDIIYFDAFSPNSQPELWEADLMESMYRALKTDGVLVTYCAKGVVKRTMKAVGFEIEALKGPPGKREMTRALKI